MWSATLTDLASNPIEPSGARRSSATSQGRSISRGRSGTSCADCVV